MDTMDQYDYVEYVIYDIHSIPRGRLVARSRFLPNLNKGIALYTGMCYFGVQHEPNVSDYFGVDRNYGNGYMVPILNTLVDGQKSARGDRKVGQVLCDLRMSDGTMEPNTPRYLAQRQLEKLSELGFTFRSAFEIEFAILDSEGRQWENRAQWCNMNVVGKCQDVMLEMFDEMSQSGVHVDSLQTEAGPGQFEITLDIAEGLKGPDMTSRFKSMSKVFLAKRNLHASFMTKIEYEDLSNGFHFNHSLWRGSSEGEGGHPPAPGETRGNAFLDPDQPDRLSNTGKQWLAGLLTHAPAITALCCPTVTCYRRLHQPWTPSKSNYAVQHRFCAFRLVTEPDNVYVECRIPSSACSPYLVTAALVAAGTDGIRRQMSLQEAADLDLPLPSSLDQALTALQEDAVIVDALGKDFVQCFTYAKRTYELDKLREMNLNCDRKLFEEEKKMYADL